MKKDKTMKTFMKKTTAAIIAATVMMTSFGGMDLVSAANTTNETQVATEANVLTPDEVATVDATGVNATDIEETGAETEFSGTWIPINQEKSATLAEYGATHYYRFTTGASSETFYRFTITNKTGNHLMYEIYDGDGKTVDNCGTAWGNSYSRESLKANLSKLQKNTDYYIKVSTDDQTTNVSYSMKITSYNDDIGDTTQSAATLSLGTNTVGYFQNEMDEDCYKFTTDSKDAFYTFSMSYVNGSYMEYRIYEDIYCINLIEHGYGWCTERGTATGKLEKLKKNHTYYIRLNTDQNAKDTIASKYIIKLSRKVDDVTDSSYSAKKLELNKTYSYVLQDETDEDYFKITTSSYTNYSFIFSNTNKNESFEVTVYSGKDCLDNQRVMNAWVGPKSSVSDSNKNLKLKRYKTYYIKVTGKAVNYKVGLHATAPDGTKVKKLSTKKAKVTWKKVSAATGYEVWRAVGKNGKYKKVKTIKKNTTLQFTNTGLKKGKVYFYKVRAYAKKSGRTYYSTFSSSKSVKIK